MVAKKQKEIYNCDGCGRNTTSKTHLCVECRGGDMGVLDPRREMKDRPQLEPLFATRAAEGTSIF